MSIKRKALKCREPPPPPGLWKGLFVEMVTSLLAQMGTGTHKGKDLQPARGEAAKSHAHTKDWLGQVASTGNGLCILTEVWRSSVGAILVLHLM